jgi:soluble lytic murein transglycosylase-like protein
MFIRKLPSPSMSMHVRSGNAACAPIALDQIQPLIKDAATRQGLREDLVRSVIERESAFKPCAVSPKGAQGLMQLMPATAQQLGVTNPLDPAQNIDGGTRYLKQLLDKYKGSIELALAAYNAGPARVDKDGGVPAIPETRDYVLGIVSKLIY